MLHHLLYNQIHSIARMEKHERKDILHCKSCIENKIKISVGHILNFSIFGLRTNSSTFFHNGYIVTGFKTAEMGFIVCFNKTMQIKSFFLTINYDILQNTLMRTSCSSAQKTACACSDAFFYCRSIELLPYLMCHTSLDFFFMEPDVNFLLQFYYYA